MGVAVLSKVQKKVLDAEVGISIDGIDSEWQRWRALDNKVRRVLGTRGRVYRMGDKWALFETDKPWDLDGIEVSQRTDGFWSAVLLRNGKPVGLPHLGVRIEEALRRAGWRR